MVSCLPDWPDISLTIFTVHLGAPALINPEVPPIDGNYPRGCVFADFKGRWL
jgi:hypothetical protein